MSGNIYLIGGGELRDGDTQLIDKDISSLVPKGATFVFFGSAAQDSGEYADVIKSVFGKHFKVKICTREKGKEYAISAIQSASVIYLGGGKTELLMKLFSEWGLKEHLATAIDKGTHTAGMSAGAQALSTYYVDEENDVLTIKQGWGLVSGCVYVHATQESQVNARKLWASHAKAYLQPFRAISENTAWRINPRGGKKVGKGNIWFVSNE